MWIYFDMDGTIADFYNTNDWLQYLINEDTSPYENAAPMANLEELVNLLQTLDIHIGIVSWCAKNSTIKYERKVRKAKLQWLKKFFPIAEEIHIVRYGTPKYSVIKHTESILFDDEQGNVDNWNMNKGAKAYRIETIRDIINTLNILF